MMTFVSKQGFCRRQVGIFLVVGPPSKQLQHTTAVPEVQTMGSGLVSGRFYRDDTIPPLSRLLVPPTTRTLCLRLPGSDPRRAVRHPLSQVPVRYPAFITAFFVNHLTTRSRKKQRFVDVAKALLDIAKESSDAFPRLKSCLGGINALIKHYEVRRYQLTLSPGPTNDF